MTEVLIPRSENIASAEYDSQTKVLVLEFRDGRTYQYSGVPQEVWMGFQNAPSKGSYFFRQIRNRFQDTEV